MRSKDFRSTRECLKRAAAWAVLGGIFLLSPGLMAGTVQTSTFFVSQFGHGTDQLGNQFSSEINLINLSSTASQVTLATFNDDGDTIRLLEQELINTAPEAVSELSVEIPGRGTAVARSLNDNPASALNTGWVQATTSNAVGIQVVFRIRDGDGNLITASNVVVGPLTSAASMLGTNSNSLKTGVALLNPPGSANASVSIRAIDSDGDMVSAFMLSPLQPGERRVGFLDELLPGLGNFNGSIEIRSEDIEDNPVPISILPLLQDQSSSVLTTQELFEPRQLP